MKAEISWFTSVVLIKLHMLIYLSHCLGITMTEKSLQKAFAQHGVLKFGNVGDVFDPSLHDALFAVPDATKTSGVFRR